MLQSQINKAIVKALKNMQELNESLYEYWVSVFYLQDGEKNLSEWDEDRLEQIEEDVFYQSSNLF